MVVLKKKHQSEAGSTGTCEYTIELCDDKEFFFFVSHKVVRIEASSAREAMEKVISMPEYSGEGWYIAQVSKPFTGCTLSQPVYDAVNGWLYDDEDI